MTDKSLPCISDSLSVQYVYNKVDNKPPFEYTLDLEGYVIHAKLVALMVEDLKYSSDFVHIKTLILIL